MEVPKVYKALVRGKDGGLESLVARGENGKSSCCALFYAEGQITYAPENSMGIFVEDTLGGAQSIAAGGAPKVKARGGVLVVHEAVPLGERLPGRWPFTYTPRYPAILLGKEVWRAEPPKPSEPEWKDVTRECTAKLDFMTEGDCTVIIAHGNNWAVEMTQEGTRVAGGYKIEAVRPAVSPQLVHYFKILKKVSQ